MSNFFVTRNLLAIFNITLIRSTLQGQMLLDSLLSWSYVLVQDLIPDLFPFCLNKRHFPGKDFGASLWRFVTLQVQVYYGQTPVLGEEVRLGCKQRFSSSQFVPNGRTVEFFHFSLNTPRTISSCSDRGNRYGVQLWWSGCTDLWTRII